MYDPIAIAALVISIGSILFVGIKEGVGLMLEYRESETIQKRKKEIDDKLLDEVKRELDLFQKVNDEGKLKYVDQLSYHSFLARSMTTKILDNMTHYIKQTYQNLALGLIMLFATLLFGFMTFEQATINSSNAVMCFFALIATLAAFTWLFNNGRKYYFLREKFVRLAENSTINYCMGLYTELQTRGLW